MKKMACESAINPLFRDAERNDIGSGRQGCDSSVGSLTCARWSDEGAVCCSIGTKTPALVHRSGGKRPESFARYCVCLLATALGRAQCFLEPVIKHPFFIAKVLA